MSYCLNKEVCLKKARSPDLWAGLEPRLLLLQQRAAALAVQRLGLAEMPSSPTFATSFGMLDGSFSASEKIPLYFQKNVLRFFP